MIGRLLVTVALVLVIVLGAALVSSPPYAVAEDAAWNCKPIADTAPRLSVGQVALNPQIVRLGIPRPAATLSPADLTACLYKADSSGKPASRMLVTDVSTRSTGGAFVDVALPEGFPSFYGEGLWQTAIVALVNKDGTIIGLGDIKYLTTAWALGISLAITVVGYLFVSWKVRPAGVIFKTLFIGADGNTSISLMQMTLWTVIAAWATIYVFLRSSDLLAMTTEVLGLLGFAGATAVSARIMAANRRAIKVDDHGRVRSPRADENSMRQATWAQLVETNGEFDLMKFQLLLFTVLIAAYVVYRLLLDGAFPKLDTNWLLLMGICNGVYLGNKFAGPSELDKMEAIKHELENVKNRITDLTNEQNKLTERKTQAEEEKQAAQDKNSQEDLSKQIDAITKRLAELESPSGPDSIAELKTRVDQLRKNLSELWDEFKKQLS